MHLTTVLLAQVTTQATRAAFHAIDVGESGLTMSPSLLNASIGDYLVFHLYSPHDVASSSLSSPCVASSSDFYSGSYGSTSGGKKKFVVRVNNTEPFYFFCSVKSHCESGMAGGVNTGQGNVDMYKQMAAGVEKSENGGSMRGGVLLEDKDVSSLTASVTATSTGTTSESTSASSTTSSSTSSSTSGVAAPTQIPGFAAGIVALVAYLV